MEAAAILRSFYGPQSSPEMPFVAPVTRAALKTVSFSRISFGSQGLFSVSQKGSLLPYVKASEAIAPPSTSDDAADTSDKTSKGPLENKNAQKSKFPNGFEALILEVCDETSVAELKMKVGDFEMHLKRDIGSSKAPTIVPPIVSPTTAPPIPSKPMVESSPSAQPAVTQKPSPATNSPFANVSTSKSSKLAALDASGANGYVIVSSPTVGSFRSGRTLKGKKQPPSCKEGDLIKEGQIIGFLDQFGNELPVRSDVAGEVLKVLYKDGEAVGYGDPLVAVLPSFHGIK